MERRTHGKPARNRLGIDLHARRCRGGSVRRCEKREHFGIAAVEDSSAAYFSRFAEHLQALRQFLRLVGRTATLRQAYVGEKNSRLALADRAWSSAVWSVGLRQARHFLSLYLKPCASMLRLSDKKCQKPLRQFLPAALPRSYLQKP